MKKLNKVLVMGLAAMMAVSAMSVSVFATGNTKITENVTTYVQLDTGEIDAIQIQVEVPEVASETEKDKIIMRAAYLEAYGEEMPVSLTRANVLLGSFNEPINNSNESGKNGTIIDTYTATGKNGFAILISSYQNLSSYNISFEDIVSSKIWYDKNLSLNSGKTVYFANGKESSITGSGFAYTQDHMYTLRLSGTRYDINNSSNIAGKVYTY